MPVLGTKVRLPSRARDLVVRGRLLDRLSWDRGRAPRLVLISAPAGSGKTTLVAQWLTSPSVAGSTVAWLALDRGDDDAHRFLTHLVAAIRAVEPVVGIDASAALDAAGGGSAQEILVSLINDLDLLAGPTVLALDDYHLIEAVEVHRAVEFLLDNLPDHVRVALVTRADPPLPLPRLRARGELIEVRAADLRFTPEEVAAFLNGVMDLRLEPAHVAALGARTEGWVTGLQLAGLSLRASAAGSHGSTSSAQFLDAFTGSHRYVLDYLIDEVLNRQPPDRQAFLLDTSVLDQLTGELCNALTGRTDGQLVLDALERDNLFVVALDQERRWYRYHHLFAEALRARRASQDPALAVALHHAATDWYCEAGMLEDALSHAVAGADHPRAADLVELGLPQLSRQRSDRTLRSWLDRVPDDEKRRRPLLATGQAWSHLAGGHLDDVVPWLDAAETALADSTAPSVPAAVRAQFPSLAEGRAVDVRELPAMIAVYRAAVAQAHGDVNGTLVHARRGLDLADSTDHASRGAAAGFLGLAAWAGGDLGSAIDTFTEAVHSLHVAGKVTDELGATVVLAQMWLARGRPDEAALLYEEAIGTAQRLSAHGFSTTGDLHVGLAEVLRERGEVDIAEDHLRRASELGDRGSLLENRHRWYTVSAGLRWSRGDLGGAVAMLDRASDLYLPGYFPDVRPIAARKARVRIAQGRLDEAWAWVRRRGVAATDPPTYLAEYDQLTLARLLVAAGRASEALPLLDRLLVGSGTTERLGSLIETRVVRALAFDADGSWDSAVAELTHALGIGVPVGYRRVFLDEGPRLGRLLSQLARGAAAPARRQAETVLAAATAARPVGRVAAVTTAPATEAGSAQAAGEELSARELDVLRLLATELSGPDIARALFVTVNTLRTHTKHIFTKLGVNTRRAAVRRAGELGLI